MVYPTSARWHGGPVTKLRYPASVGLEVARELCAALKPVTERLIVAGSLRRRKPDIGDLELLYIERFETRPDPADLFAHPREFNLTDETIAGLERDGVLERRTSEREVFDFVGLPYGEPWERR